MKETSIIHQASFNGCKREKLLNYKTYAAEADDLLARIPRSHQRLNDPEWLADKDSGQLMMMTWGRAGYALDLISLQYSAGAPISELRALFVTTLDYFEEYAKYSYQYNHEQGPGYKSPLIPLGDAEFDKANRLVSFAILLGLEAMLGRIASLIDYDCAKPDGMLDRLLSIYMSGRTNPDECTRHLPYFKTLKIFSAKESERPKLLSEYLAEWYIASRREPYFDSHKRGAEFRGYWSWEAGAITVALGIDDSEYRNEEFYPRELVEFALDSKTAYSPIGSPSLEMGELRSKAGDKCPKAGLWRSLDIHPTNVRYGVGETMENLGSVYGLTVWKFLED